MNFSLFPKLTKCLGLFSLSKWHGNYNYLIESSWVELNLEMGLFLLLLPLLKLNGLVIAKNKTDKFKIISTEFKERSLYYVFAKYLRTGSNNTYVIDSDGTLSSSFFVVVFVMKWYFVTEIVLAYCEKKIPVIEKTFWNSRLKAKKLQNFWDH